MNFRRGLSLLLAGLLAACAHLPGYAPPAKAVVLPPPLAFFQLEGRVSVKTDAESFSGGMTWRHAPERQTLLLSTPLGQGVAELHGDERGVELRDSAGRVHHAADAETLVHQALGVTLPVKGLAWWVVGNVRPDTHYQAEADADGRLAVLQQDGWRIEFSRYAESAGRFLPGKLIARRGDDLEIRVVVDQWNLTPDAGSAP